MKRNTWTDHLILSEIVIIGLAEAVHLAGIVFGWTLQRCTMWLLGAVGIMCVLLAGVLVSKCLILSKKGRRQETGEDNRQMMPNDRAEWILLLIFIAGVVLQLLFIWMAEGPYVDGDMMAETVESFLETDHIYRRNPMTGQPYTTGIPSRLKILCLPTLYCCLCRIFDSDAGIMVWRIVPTVTLFSSYVSFYALACCVFPVSGRNAADGRKKRMCFLIVVSLLMWTETYFYALDGFQLLYCGWRGTAIRNGVLLPWLLALCMRRKWLSAFLCILAEACMVWTFYGMGVCLLMIVGMAVAEGCNRERSLKLTDSFWEADSEECTK